MEQLMEKVGPLVHNGESLLVGGWAGAEKLVLISHCSHKSRTGSGEPPMFSPDTRKCQTTA